MKKIGEILYLTVITSAILFSFMVMSGCAPYVGDTQSLPGVQGAPGLPGAIGLPGTPGLDATPVKVVNLCPGASKYPQVFVESALCIDHKLYGIYSVAGGFFSLLPEGDYTSKTIGSACSFKVLPDCAIKPL